MNIFAYNPGSRSARALSEALGCNMIRHEGSRFRGGQRKTVINWGASILPEEVLKCNILNKVVPVRMAGNKLSTFNVLQRHGVSIPEYTEGRETAIRWLEEGRVVVARQSLTGHSGRGIVILERGLDFVEAPLYTTYVPKSAEYRVHVMRGEGGHRVIDVQRKVRDPEREVTDWKVRSHDNGFIFIRNNDEGVSYMTASETSVREQAVNAVRVLGLDFGGVDVLYNAKRRQTVVLECNTACGLEGESVRIYADGFRRIV